MPLRPSLGGLAAVEDEVDGMFNGKVETRLELVFGAPEAGAVGCWADTLRRPLASLLIPDNGCRFGKPGGDMGCWSELWRGRLSGESFCNLLALGASSGGEPPAFSACGFVEELPLLGGGCLVRVPRFTSGEGGIGDMI